MRSASAARSRPASRQLPPRRPIDDAGEEPVNEVEVTNEVTDSTDAPAAEAVEGSDEREHEDQPDAVVEAVEAGGERRRGCHLRGRRRRGRAVLQARAQLPPQEAGRRGRGRRSAGARGAGRRAGRGRARGCCRGCCGARAPGGRRRAGVRRRDAADDLVAEAPQVDEPPVVEIAAVHELPEADADAEAVADLPAADADDVPRCRRRRSDRLREPATTPPITRGTRKTPRTSLPPSSPRSSTTVLQSRTSRMQTTRRFCPQPSPPRP